MNILNLSKHPVEACQHQSFCLTNYSYTVTTRYHGNRTSSSAWNRQKSYQATFRFQLHVHVGEVSCMKCLASPWRPHLPPPPPPPPPPSNKSLTPSQKCTQVPTEDRHTRTGAYKHSQSPFLQSVRGPEARPFTRQLQYCSLLIMPHVDRSLSPRVSTICLPEVTAHDQISQTSPLCI